MDEEEIVFVLLAVHLPDRFQKRHTLYVANRTTYLYEAHIRITLLHNASYACFYLVRHMWDYLHRLPQIVPFPFSLYHCGINETRSYIMLSSQLYIHKPLVIPQIKVYLGTIAQNVHLAMLKRVHCPCIYVYVRVNFYRHDFVSPVLQYPTDGRHCDALSKPTHHTPCHNYILHRTKLIQ